MLEQRNNFKAKNRMNEHNRQFQRQCPLLCLHRINHSHLNNRKGVLSCVCVYAVRVLTILFSIFRVVPFSPISPFLFAFTLYCSG